VAELALVRFAHGYVGRACMPITAAMSDGEP
jgi:hypothetical protein